MEKDCKPENSIFSSTIIAYCMGFLNSEKAVHVVNKTRGFLIDEIIYPGIWSYLSSQDSSTIIPDIDDTCCASFVLKEFHPWISKGKNIPLILNNRNKDGLFYTWIDLFPQAKDINDVDSVVNANILFYLGEREETRDAIGFLNRIISQNKEEDTYWYYLNNLSLYYMVSRACYNGVETLRRSSDLIIRNIVSQQQNDGSFGDELNTALAISTFLNFYYSDLSVLKRGITHIIETQEQKGNWKRTAFYAGPRPPVPHFVWFGSETLTTALCVEALARFKGILTRED